MVEPAGIQPLAKKRQSGLKVLIVEDNLLIALDLAAQVRAAGHTVIGEAMTADDAVRLAEEHRPDVALMDLLLAGPSSGEDAAERIKEKFGIRCIFISGNLDPATRERLSRLEPYATLSKPVLPHRLREALAGVG